jgi:hypothetical protein
MATFVLGLQPGLTVGISADLCRYARTWWNRSHRPFGLGVLGSMCRTFPSKGRTLTKYLLSLYLPRILLINGGQQDRPREWGWHMNHRGGFRNRRDRRSSLFSYVGVRRRDLDSSTDRLTADRLAGVLSCVDSPPAATTRPSLGVSQPTSVAGPLPHPEALAPAHGGSVPAVLASPISAPAVMKRGRHRSHAPRKLAILKVPVALPMVVATRPDRLR